MTIGKRIFDDLYVHLSALDLLDDLERRDRVNSCIALLSPEQRESINVAKINLRNARVSLLEYQDFDESAFPELSNSWSFDRDLAREPTFRTYSSTLNPPILHRKELLVHVSHPKREKWSEVTSTAEALGLFDETKTIGFRLNWERLIASKGYRLVSGEFHPLGNDHGAIQADTSEVTNGDIRRHLTALSRVGLSAPVQLLLKHGLLRQDITFFDYGCGRGGDVSALAAEGFNSCGWDPHYAPSNPIFHADVVNLGFVVNVIEDPAERVDAIHKAFALARRVMAVSVMLYGNESPGRPYGDGVITSRNTFQKYFSQTELKDYIEQVLHQEAFMIAPGIAFVFVDKDLEQRFNADRYRKGNFSARLLALRFPLSQIPRPKKVTEGRTPRPSRIDEVFTAARSTFDVLWTLALELGRLPERDEVPDAEMVERQAGSFKNALRVLTLRYDRATLVEAAKSRADDLRLYFATLQVAKRRPYKSLEARLQRDVKTFFGDYRQAQDSGLRLLMEAAQPALLRTAARNAAQAGIGYLTDDRALQLHLSLVETLPVVLRVYVACGMLLYDAVSDFQLVKIHIDSGKLTLLKYDDFDSSPLPLLTKRIKISIRRQDYEVFDYQAPEFPKPLLFWKSRYLNEDMPGYAEQLSFDEELEATNAVSTPEHEPSLERLHEALESKRKSIVANKLVRSRRIPDVDEKCGENFTYRQFIECGETQRRLGISNIPLRAETYNAIYDLATNVLDPLIDYFGAVKLTYGFCSTALAKQIPARIAPKIDQHVSCEFGRSGKPVCERQGAACDFVVEDEEMEQVAAWIISNLPFDRLYFYGKDRPIHVSFGPQQSRAAYKMTRTANGFIVPKPFAKSPFR